MSILYKSECSTMIDHCQFISKMYEDVTTDTGEIQSFALSSNIFSIKSTTKASKDRKRKMGSDNILKETELVKKMYSVLTQELPSEIKCDIFNKYNLMETSEVRELAAKLFESTIVDLNGMSGGNNSDAPLKCKAKDSYFLIPPKSRFYCGCVKAQCVKLAGNKYDIVIADPPWWNKYIRRLKGANEKLSYSMMYNEDIAALPVRDLLSDNCLVAVWCTNSPSNINAVKELIFPKWGVEYVTTWYWLKLTIDLEPLCDFGTGCKKQPYERVIIGKVGDVKEIPHNHMFASVPSALHSHKLPLLDLLTQYVNCENPHVLELFARYLLPNTTSVGYEPLKWQHISLYDVR
ncbi:DNA N6-methyl methyltransferase [Epargyreus clarus]|uniref:DNA N6-methyl methyltransferase n=1 Tax=Epargyreus clarus TaxID=520877 RepID=UPI003C2DE4F4